MSKREMILLGGSMAVMIPIVWLFHQWISDKNQGKVRSTKGFR